MKIRNLALTLVLFMVASFTIGSNSVEYLSSARNISFVNISSVNSKILTDKQCKSLMKGFTFGAKDGVRIQHADNRHSNVSLLSSEPLDSNRDLNLASAVERINIDGNSKVTTAYFSYIRNKTQKTGKGVFFNSYCKGSFATQPY